jgi:hypothetical protein
MSQGKYIGNVNILDIRKATPEAVAEISGIGNCNLVLYSPETSSLLAKLGFGNLNSSIELPTEVKVDTVMGKTTIRKEYFDNQPAPVYLVVMGVITFDPDVTAENIEKGINGLVIMGEAFCPEHLQGAVQAKTRSLMGKIKTYPALKHVRREAFELDLNALSALEDKTEMVVLDSLSMPDVLPDALFVQKISKLFVMGESKCHAENADALKARLLDGSGPVTAIPTGFTVVDKPLVIDNDLLESLSAKKLWCEELVQIDAGVTAAVLDEHLENIIGQDRILCPLALKSTFAKKCDLLKNKVVFFEGMLWKVDDERTLRATFLETVEEKITLFVTGELTIDPAVDYKLLADRLTKVHNFGEIRCTPDQMGVIQARLGLSEGALEDSTQKEAPAEPSGEGIGNANYLTL